MATKRKTPENSEFSIQCEKCGDDITTEWNGKDKLICINCLVMAHSQKTPENSEFSKASGEQPLGHTNSTDSTTIDNLQRTHIRDNRYNQIAFSKLAKEIDKMAKRLSDNTQKN